MARAPRPSVSMSSGQGTSRLAYQKGRALTQSANPPSVKSPGAIGGNPYAKGPKVPGAPPSGLGPPSDGGMNVAFGNTGDLSDPTDVGNLQGIASAFPKRPPRNPPKGPAMAFKPGKVMK